MAYSNNSKKTRNKNSGKVETPEDIHQYVIGTGTLVRTSDPEIKRYKKELDKHLPQKPIRVYRAFRAHGPPEELEGDASIFAKGFAMSFTESEKTALAIAKQGAEDGLEEGEYFHVITLLAPKNRIYFHHAIDKETGKLHPKEKEIMDLKNTLADTRKTLDELGKKLAAPAPIPTPVTTPAPTSK